MVPDEAEPPRTPSTLQRTPLMLAEKRWVSVNVSVTVRGVIASAVVGALMRAAGIGWDTSAPSNAGAGWAAVVVSPGRLDASGVAPSPGAASTEDGVSAA